MHKVTRRFDFSYGHRLLDHKGKCRFLHGHNAVVELTVNAPLLDAQSMVVDFGDISAVAKPWLNDTFDHRVILNETDPLAAVLKAQGEPVLTLRGNPTAENLSRFIYEGLRKAGLHLCEVRFWETPNSFASYIGESND